MLTDMRKSSTDPLLRQNGVAGQHGLAMGRGGAERGPNMPETLRRNLQMWSVQLPSPSMSPILRLAPMSSSYSPSPFFSSTSLATDTSVFLLRLT